MTPDYSIVFTDWVKNIINKYRDFKPQYLTTAIGFTAVASEMRPVFSPAIDADCLIFGFNVDFSNAGVTLKITDTSSGYVWNVLQPTVGQAIQGSPIVAIAGITTQVMPVLRLICPFFLSRQSKLQYDFQNSAAGPTTGGNISAVAIKLLS
jgi:hypothetical protein